MKTNFLYYVCGNCGKAELPSGEEIRKLGAGFFMWGVLIGIPIGLIIALLFVNP